MIANTCFDYCRVSRAGGLVGRIQQSERDGLQVGREDVPRGRAGQSEAEAQAPEGENVKLVFVFSAHTFVKDMFEKMLQIDPNAPTADEIRVGGVTKPRYMVWRETISSTATLGFRIEGIRKQDGSSSKDFKTVGTSSQIVEVLREFVKGQPRALVSFYN